MALRSEWDRLRLGMELLSKAVAEEILRYPAPFPASDARYKILLELRRLLPTELARLDMAIDNGSVTVAEFIRSSPCRDTLSALLERPQAAGDR